MKLDEIPDPLSSEDQQIDRMVLGAQNALQFILSVKENDKLLVITDNTKKTIGKAFENGARKLGARANSYLLPEEKRPLSEVPEELNLLLGDCKVFVNAFSANAEETPFRIKLIKLQQSIGARVGHAPGITEDMMLKGPMTVDYQEVAENAKQLLSAFKSALRVRITTNEGTDLSLKVLGREFETDVRIEPGSMGNLPAGEIWCAPIEDGANGVIFVNGAIGDLGGVKKILIITVKNGKIESLESEDNALVERIKELISIDDMASVIGELGIGLNPKAQLTGNLLEDEKAGGTAHIAFGNNESMVGGQNTSGTHRDFLFYNPTFNVEYEDGSKREIIKDGKFVL